MNNLKNLYQDKYIENCKEFNDNYYYFYNQSSIFGIHKSISFNEYELLKSFYVEKKVYQGNSKTQKIFEYIYENASYPFNAPTKMVLIQSDDEEMISVISDVYNPLGFIQIYDFTAFFVENDESLDSLPLDDLLITISNDFGLCPKVHESFVLDEDFCGMSLVAYFEAYRKHLSKLFSHSDFSDIMLLESGNEAFSSVEVYLKNLFQDATLKNTILQLFANDLNVSKTSKELYINRNSLLNKLEQIKKQTGINLLKLKHACVIYRILL